MEVNICKCSLFPHHFLFMPMAAVNKGGCGLKVKLTPPLPTTYVSQLWNTLARFCGYELNKPLFFCCFIFYFRRSFWLFGGREVKIKTYLDLCGSDRKIETRWSFPIMLRWVTGDLHECDELFNAMTYLFQCTWQVAGMKRKSQQLANYIEIDMSSHWTAHRIALV